MNCFGTVSIVFIGIVAAIAIPNLLASRRAANEASAISSLRTITSAEMTYISTAGDGNCGDMKELGEQRLIDSVLASGQKHGYKFTVVKAANGACELHATPLQPDGVAKSGTRSFYVSSMDWEIRAANKNGAPADKNDPMLKMLTSSSRRRQSDDDF